MARAPPSRFYLKEKISQETRVSRRFCKLNNWAQPLLVATKMTVITDGRLTRYSTLRVVSIVNWDCRLCDTPKILKPAFKTQGPGDLTQKRSTVFLGRRVLCRYPAPSLGLALCTVFRKSPWPLLLPFGKWNDRSLPNNRIHSKC